MTPQKHLPESAFGMRSFWLFIGCMLVLIVIYLSLAPVPTQPNVTQSDKFLHVLAYAALMSWFANLYIRSPSRVRFAVGFVALGIALEFVQRWTGYRTFEVADMVANATGVAVGWLCAPPRIPNYLQGIEKLFRM
jgi:VanZ family protein